MGAEDRFRAALVAPASCAIRRIRVSVVRRRLVPPVRIAAATPMAVEGRFLVAHAAPDSRVMRRIRACARRLRRALLVRTADRIQMVAAVRYPAALAPLASLATHPRTLASVQRPADRLARHAVATPMDAVARSHAERAGRDVSRVPAKMPLRSAPA